MYYKFSILPTALATYKADNLKFCQSIISSDFSILAGDTLCKNVNEIHEHSRIWNLCLGLFSCVLKQTFIKSLYLGRRQAMGSNRQVEGSERKGFPQYC